MKETKLLSMCDYVLQAKGDVKDSLCEQTFDVYRSVYNYALFLQTPLELKRFIACKDGVPIGKPILYEYYIAAKDNEVSFKAEFKEYEEALKDVWFVGFELVEFAGFTLLGIELNVYIGEFIDGNMSFDEERVNIESL